MKPIAEGGQGNPFRVPTLMSGSPIFAGVTSALVLCFVGLLASVTLQLVRVAPWSPASGLIAVAALAALVAKVDLLWVVLAGAALSAMVF